jgi:hypothetical protein
MPYCLCPACHQPFHLLVLENIDGWYERFAPGLDRDKPVPTLCFKCWQQARAGSLQVEDLNVPAQLLGRLRYQLSMSDDPAEHEAQPSPEDLVTLFRPTGLAELELVRESGYRRWPPRLPDQPIFYPVTNERYATEIASRWNTKDGKSGFVTKFLVRAEFMRRYEIHQVGAAHHTEWWVPATELEELNGNIVGLIEVVAKYPTAS